MQSQSSSEPKPEEAQKSKPQSREIIKYIMKQKARIKSQKYQNKRFPKYLYPYQARNLYALKCVAKEANKRTGTIITELQKLCWKPKIQKPEEWSKRFTTKNDKNSNTFNSRHKRLQNHKARNSDTTKKIFN